MNINRYRYLLYLYDRRMTDEKALIKELNVYLIIYQNQEMSFADIYNLFNNLPNHMVEYNSTHFYLDAYIKKK